jgi:hypothetical protein
MLHGFYSGLDILKMLITFGLAMRLVIRRKPERESERAWLPQEAAATRKG